MMLALTLPLIAAFLFFLLAVNRVGSGSIELRHPSRIERLEPRIAPAALTAKLSGGVLTVTGDPVAQTILLVQNAGTIDVLDGAASLGPFQGVKSIVLRMEGDANLSAQLDEGGIAGGIKVIARGACQFSLGVDSQIGGSVSFVGDSSVQSLLIGGNVRIGKSLTFSGGGGMDDFAMSSGAAISGSATFAAVEFGNFQNTTPIEIGGSLNVKNTGNLLNSTFMGTNSGFVNIAGSINFAGGKGADSMFILTSTDGGVRFVDKSGQNSFGLGLNSSIAGSLVMIGGAGNDSLNILGGQIQGGVTLRLGEGDNTFSFGIAGPTTIGKNVVMVTGSGNDRWLTSGSSMAIGGNVTMQLGDGNNIIAANPIVEGTRVQIRVGSGADIVSLDGNALNAKLSIFTGAGADELAGSLLRNSVSAYFAGGAGVDHFYENNLTGDPILIIGFENFT